MPRGTPKKFGTTRPVPVDVRTYRLFRNFAFDFNITPRGEWADPGGTAIPGQPVGKSEQAPASSPSAKNQFNIDVPRWGTYQILS